MAKMTDDTLLKHLQSNGDDAAQYGRGHQRVSSRVDARVLPGAVSWRPDGWSQIVTSECRTRWNGYCPSCWT